MTNQAGQAGPRPGSAGSKDPADTRESIMRLSKETLALLAGAGALAMSAGVGQAAHLAKACGKDDKK